MNLKSVKKENEVNLHGVLVAFERQDNSIMGVTIRDGNGGTLVVRQGPYSSLNVFIPAPPSMVKRWKIEGELKGLRFSELFEDKWKAETRLNDLGVEGIPIEVEVPE